VEATLLTFIRRKDPRAESKLILIPLYDHSSTHILRIRFSLSFSSTYRSTCSRFFIFFLVLFSLLSGHIFLNIQQIEAVEPYEL
jgi:hypothetical protein